MFGIKDAGAVMAACEWRSDPYLVMDGIQWSLVNTESGQIEAKILHAPGAVGWSVFRYGSGLGEFISEAQAKKCAEKAIS